MFSPKELVGRILNRAKGMVAVIDTKDDNEKKCQAEDPMKCRVHGPKVCETYLKKWAAANGFPPNAASVKSIGKGLVAARIEAKGKGAHERAVKALADFFAEMQNAGCEKGASVLPSYVTASFRMKDMKDPEEDGKGKLLPNGKIDDGSDNGEEEDDTADLKNKNAKAVIQGVLDKNKMQKAAKANEGMAKKPSPKEDLHITIEDDEENVTRAEVDKQLQDLLMTKSVYANEARGCLAEVEQMEDENPEADLTMLKIRMEDYIDRLDDVSGLSNDKYEAALARFGEGRVSFGLAQQAMNVQHWLDQCKKMVDEAYKEIRAAKSSRKAGGVERKAVEAALAQRLEDLSRPLKPLKHDAKAFPKELTTEMIDGAEDIGLGSTGACLLEVDGKKYIMKAASKYMGEAENPDAHIESEYNADCFYRNAGINVPDCQLYEVDGRKVKLSAFIPNAKSLGEWWDEADEGQRAAMRDELLAGYPVDALIGNWDVIGLDADNVLVDEDGHPWRCDNGSAFDFRAMGAKKADAAWKDRKFPDEWRTLRESEINERFFGDLTANEIFTSASKFDFAALVAQLPEDVQTPSLKKCAREMKQMAERCVDHNIGGYGGPNGGSSDMLEFSYDLSKRGFREACPKSVGVFEDFGTCRTGGEFLEDGSKSLVEMFHRELSDSFGLDMPKDTADWSYSDPNGVLGFLSRAISEEGFDTYNQYTQRMRMCEIGLRGGDFETVGDESCYKSDSDGERKAVEFYQKNPDQYEQDKRVVAAQKAMMQLFLENTNVAGNDRKSHSLFIVRTEGKNVTTADEYQRDGYHVTPDTFVRFKSAGLEAWSSGKRVIPNTGYSYDDEKEAQNIPNGATETMCVAVPYSRVVAGYWFEREPGRNADCFYDTPEGKTDCECEVLADTWDCPMPKFYSSDEFGEFDDYQKSYRSALRKLMSKKGKFGRTEYAKLRKFTEDWDSEWR